MSEINDLLEVTLYAAKYKKEVLKWSLVNAAESFDELKKAIATVAEEGIIEGRSRTFMAERQIKAVDLIMNGYPYNLLTRSYGIRQQMMYLMHCKKLEDGGQDI